MVGIQLVEFPPPIKLPDMEDFLGSLGMASLDGTRSSTTSFKCTSAPHKGCIMLKTVVGITSMHNINLFPGSAPRLNPFDLGRAKVERDPVRGLRVLSKTPQGMDEYGWCT